MSDTPRIRLGLDISSRLEFHQKLVMTPRIRKYVDIEEWRGQLDLPRRIKKNPDETEQK